MLPAAFRTAENLLLLLFALVLIAPLVAALWGWRRYRRVGAHCAAVLGTFSVIVLVPLLFWAAAHDLHPDSLLALEAPASFEALVLAVILYLCLYPVYVGLSANLFAALLAARKRQRPAR